jgi:acetyltransferase-like isoleucine patch superfamily enzyme
MNNSSIYPNVFIDPDDYIGEFVIIGMPPKGVSAGELATRIGKGALIRSHSVIYAGNLIGKKFQAGHGVLIRELNEIGDNVSIGSHSVVEHHVLIGDRVRIHSNAFIPEYSHLENESWIGPNVVLTNARYPLSPEVKKNLKGPHILEGAMIGANSTLLPGILVGKKALIGAGSVVIRDVPDRAVMVGNPARIIGDISELPEYRDWFLRNGEKSKL